MRLPPCAYSHPFPAPILQAPKALATPEGNKAAPSAPSPGGMKLTFPVATASYMAGTKSSSQKTQAVTAAVAPADVAVPKPRIKSAVVGPRGDDR